MKKFIPIILLSLISLAPLTYPLIFPYNPPLEAVKPYQTHHVTDTTYFGNITKNIQSLKEEEPCIYTILGWNEVEHLYYESICEGVGQIHVYAPETKTHITVEQAPDDLVKESYADDALLEMVRATGVRPEKHEPYTRPIYLLPDTATQSPTSAYIAFVTKRTYSVQDIVLITQ